MRGFELGGRTVPKSKGVREDLSVETFGRQKVPRYWSPRRLNRGGIGVDVSTSAGGEEPNVDDGTPPSGRQRERTSQESGRWLRVAGSSNVVQP